jgi:transcriptional regulator with XRE-family HTH domain
MSVNIAVVLDNIRIQRGIKGYSQDYLAARLNISQNAYSKMELGYTQLSLLRLFQIAAILEIEVEALFEQ